MESIEEKLRRLFPVAAKGDASWNTRQMQHWADRITEVHAEIADRRQAKYADRVKMDRVAHEIALRITSVNQAMQVLMALGQGPKSAPDEALKRHVTLLMQSGELSRPEEEIIRQMVLAIVHKSTSFPSSLLSISLEELCLRPEVLEVLDDIVIESVEHSATSPAGYADHAHDYPRFASLLMEPVTPLPAQVKGGKGYVEYLRNSLEAKKRSDLLRLLGNVNELSGVNEAVRKLRDRAKDDLERLFSCLDREWSRLESLACWAASLVRNTTQSSRASLLGAPASVDDPRLEAEWLRRLVAAAKTAADKAVDRLRLEVQASESALRPRLEELLEKGQFVNVIRLMNRPEPPLVYRQVRHTEWRDQAASLWSQPDQALQVVPKPFQELVETWRRSQRRVATDKALVKRFVAAMLPAQQAPESAELRTRMREMIDLRNYLDKEGLNPCYLPQLSLFHRLVVHLPSVEQLDTDYVRLTASEVSGLEQSLVIVLAPGLSDSRRRALINEFSTRKLRAAVIDDLDLCRLINPGRDRTIDRTLGLLEIAFEQQDWERLTGGRAGKSDNLGRQAAQRLGHAVHKCAQGDGSSDDSAYATEQRRRFEGRQGKELGRTGTKHNTSPVEKRGVLYPTATRRGCKAGVTTTPTGTSESSVDRQ